MTDTRRPFPENPAPGLRPAAVAVRLRATDKRTGLTLGELRDACDELLRYGASPTSELKVTTTMRGRLSSVEIAAR